MGKNKKIKNKLLSLAKSVKKNLIKGLWFNSFQEIGFIIYPNTCDHVVILNSLGIPIYDNYFSIPIPNYNENLAVRQAICNKDVGLYKEFTPCRVITYLALQVCICGTYYVILVSNESINDPRNIAWRLLLTFDQGFITQNTDVAVSIFTQDAVFSSPGGSNIGINEIIENISSYVNVYDRNVVLPARRFMFDPLTNSGCLERLWSAVSLTTDNYYEQDDAIVFRLRGNLFDYVHEYFDTAQTVSNYSPPPPQNCCF